jgi:DNA-binding MarR family transcriptional regulator
MNRTVQEIGLSIKRLQVRHHRALDAALAPLDISLVQWDALRHLDEHPNASLHDLAVLTFQSDPAFGTLANRMVERGLIKRVDGAGRAVRHRITSKGRKVLEASYGIVDRTLETSLAGLSPDQQQTLGDLIARVLDYGA